jgi:cysteinyl-tRNA synthetase
MPIRLHESLSRSLRELKPAQPDGVFRFYNCGPTVYAPAHIGNFRSFVVNDVIRRLLELEFGKDKVKHVRNLTDVDDKTIRAPGRRSRPLAAVTQQWTDKFHADCAALNCLAPHVEPTATGHIKRAGRHDRRAHEEGQRLPRAPMARCTSRCRPFDDYGKLSPREGTRTAGRQRTRRQGARRGRRREGGRQRLRALEGAQDRRRRQRVGQPVGPRPPRLAHRVQRDEQETPRRDDRPAHRGRRPALPAPRE